MIFLHSRMWLPISMRYHWYFAVIDLKRRKVWRLWHKFFLLNHTVFEFWNKLYSISAFGRTLRNIYCMSVILVYNISQSYSTCTYGNQILLKCKTIVTLHILLIYFKNVVMIQMNILMSSVYYNWKFHISQCKLQYVYVTKV